MCASCFHFAKSTLFHRIRSTAAITAVSAATRPDPRVSQLLEYVKAHVLTSSCFTMEAWMQYAAGTA